ncbi:hypothetical protein PBV87_00680 [Niameybacter massiliensis]|uniref:Uncharacterized protein n=1 Tax=Holtiella tumoricola TaxID=3018743 RepID=A0AA42DJC5_9FIRM|nr:hypothetical protein [Holtiella tumoricola]MDA3730027.1 hypothetical protein [Holtiella tumoricola]
MQAINNYASSLSNIKMITMDEARKIEQDRSPLGKFIIKEGSQYIAMDNTTGDACVGHFSSYEECMSYLNSENEALEIGSVKAVLEVSVSELNMLKHALSRYIDRENSSELSRKQELSMYRRIRKMLDFYYAR